jgi:toxin ParE1/3/4
VVKIVFSKSARFDLKEIVDYIKRDSAKYALLEKQKIKDAIDTLLTQPLLGRIVPEFTNGVFRELIFRNYRIIYEIISKEEINILSIHHHARLISNNPAFKNDE